MHNVLGLHEYDGLLSRFEEAYSQYRERTRIPIFFSVNEGYTPYLAVCLESLAQNSSKTEQYRIIVLYDDVKTITRIKLANVVKDYSNITIEFVEINKQNEEITDEEIITEISNTFNKVLNSGGIDKLFLRAIRVSL